MSLQTPASVQPSHRRAELDSLQAQLADRVSTVRFAHAGVSMVAAFIVSGAAGKLFWDARKFPSLAIVVAGIALGLLVYSVAQYLSGRRHLRRELELLAAMKSLRQALGLDDPSALLPQ